MIHGELCKNHNNSVTSSHIVKMSHWQVCEMHTRFQYMYSNTDTKVNLAHTNLVCTAYPKFEFSRLNTDYSLVDYTPFVTACYLKMTFSPVFWTDVLMMHEMCRLAVLVLFQCSVPPSKLVIGASMSYLWDSSCLFKEDLLHSSHGNRSANVNYSDSYFMSELKCLSHPSYQL